MNYTKDRQWILNKNRLSKEYVKGIESFMKAASKHVDENNETQCPCKKCQNMQMHSLSVVNAHLHRDGMAVVYNPWIYHGEEFKEPGQKWPPSGCEETNGSHDDIYDMLNDRFPRDINTDHESLHEENPLGGVDAVQSDSRSNVHRVEANKYEELIAEANREFFPGCNESLLTAMVMSMNCKVDNHWTNKSFDSMLKILKHLCPSPNNIPTSYYATNKMLRALGLGEEKIDACVNDCALFYKEHEKKDKCPECNEPRYKPCTSEKKRRSLRKYCDIFLLSRGYRDYSCRNTSINMRWHKDKRVDEEGVMRHPADSLAWKEFDKMYPDFAQDPRNVRLGLATDGFNPFGNMSTSYSMWPVIVVPYNLPPWMCMKTKYSMLSLLIPGPKAPGKDIDVYLRPLIDELKELWEEGVRTYDKLTDSGFTLRAAVMWTINDFPAYGNLSGWSTKGYLACPVCLHDTSSRRLRYKLCYIGHRRYLRRSDPMRMNSADFDGTCENRNPPREFSGDDILEMLNHLRYCKPGKHPDNADRKRKRTSLELNWTKKSIFFELEYWSKLKIRHNLDVMHVERNVCDNVVGTILGIEGKTKDTHNARLDLMDMNIRKDLHLDKEGPNKINKFPAIYTMKPPQRRDFCDFLKSVKFPDGYAANISRHVKDGKISGLKTHDCHVLLQRLLPVGIRPYLPEIVCEPLIELSSFFEQICAKTLKVADLDRLQHDIIVILCKLEKIFPPAFFDVMIHLAVHLPHEAKIAGPVGYRWMYPIERMMGTLKGYVLNKARPEGSAIQGFVAKESLTFCSMYLRNGETSFPYPERNDDGGEIDAKLSVFSQKARPFNGYKMVQFSETEMESVYWYILDNCDEIELLRNEHFQLLQNESSSDLEQRHRKEFPKWFKNRIQTLYSQDASSVDKELYALSYGPDTRVSTFTGCVVNGVRWHAKHIEETRTTQSSGVMVPGTRGEGESDFYGRLISVLDIGFINDYHVILFNCEWFNTEPQKTRRRGNKGFTNIPRLHRDYHLTSVNINNLWYKDNPYVLAKQAKQIFYLNDVKLGNGWKVIQKIQHRHVWDVPENEVVHEAETTYDVPEEVENNS